MFKENPRRTAEMVSRLVPVPPLRVIFNECAGPLIQLNEAVQTQENNSVRGAQSLLDQSLALGIVPHTKPGIKAEVVYWDGRDGLVAAFNRKGALVGYGHASWNQDPKRGEKTSHLMIYDTAYIVATDYTGQGLASTMMGLLENHIALNNQGFGAGFFYTIEAQTERERQAARRLIEKIGARPSNRSNRVFMRLNLKPELYKGFGNQKPPYTRASGSLDKPFVLY